MSAAFVAPTAIVEERAVLGKGTKVWHFSHILPGAKVGRNCTIGQNVVIGSGVRIGHGCKIQDNACIFKGVVLEDYVFVGPSVVFTNVYNPRAEIPRMSELLPTLVRKGASIGANATILCGVVIGRYAMVGAGTVVIANVKDYAVVVGNPARQVGWMSRAGGKLSFETGNEARCPLTGEIYVLRKATVCKKVQKRGGLIP